MAKTKDVNQNSISYHVRGSNQVIKAGDCVLMQPCEPNKPPYVARVEKLEANNKGETTVEVRWYYRPEEAIGGRRQFHGEKEVFLSDHYDLQSANTIIGKCIVHSFKAYCSDHYDLQSANTIIGKCIVHSFKAYCELEEVAVEDYYSRFEYQASSGEFTSDRVAVFCKCEMPYNPDTLMIQCDECQDWYHPACVKMTTARARQLSSYVCDECA